jgi:hypothetical protein
MLLHPPPLSRGGVEITSRSGLRERKTSRNSLQTSPCLITTATSASTQSSRLVSSQQICKRSSRLNDSSTANDNQTTTLTSHGYLPNSGVRDEDGQGLHQQRSVNETASFDRADPGACCCSDSRGQTQTSGTQTKTFTYEADFVESRPYEIAVGPCHHLRLRTA